MSAGPPGLTSSLTGFWRSRSGRRLGAYRLQAALPDVAAADRRRILGRSFAHQARVERELRALGRLDPARLCARLDLEGWDRIETAEKEGRGVVFLTASLGMVELLPIVLSLYKGGVERIGAASDGTTFAAPGARAARDDGGAGGPRYLAQLDRPAANGAVETRLLGGAFAASSEPAETVLARGCPALPLFAFLEAGARFRVAVRAPVAPADLAVDAAALTARFVAAIEREILERPEQYDWSLSHEPRGVAP